MLLRLYDANLCMYVKCKKQQKKEKMLSIEACHSIRESCKIFVRQNNCPDNVQLLYRGINSPDQTPANSVEYIAQKYLGTEIYSAIFDAFEVLGRQYPKLFRGKYLGSECLD